MASEPFVRVLKARHYGGYGMCETCKAPNTASYAILNRDSEGYSLGYLATCAIHLAMWIDSVVYQRRNP